MDNPNNNTPAGNQQDNSKPKLKKVKRPIRRTPPQMPQSSSGQAASAGSNPFQQQPVAPRPAVDAFNADSILNISNLPQSMPLCLQTQQNSQMPQLLMTSRKAAYGSDYLSAGNYRQQ